MEDLNVALQRPAQASSIKAPGREAANAVDGNPQTRWTSTYADDQWLSVDLGQAYELTRVSVRWEVAHAETYLLEGSLDGASWATLASERGKEGWVATALPSGSRARWLRVFGQRRATSFGFSIWELRVFSQQAAAAGAAAARPAARAVGKAAARAAPARAGGQAGEDSYEVLQARVPVRTGPSMKASMVGVMKQGDRVRGVVSNSEGQQWLRIEGSAMEEVHLKLPASCDAGWAIMDGKALGVIAQKAPAAAPDAGKAKAKDVLKSTKDEAPEPEIHSTPFAPAADFIVVHEKVVERRQPSVDARAIKVHDKGEVLWGTPHFVAQTATPWLRLEKEKGGAGWMLIDGVSVGLGQLLQPAKDITEGLLRWARQHKKTLQGQQIEWTQETEEELQRMEKVARSQIALLKPLCSHKAVLAELVRKHFINGEDFTLGVDGVATQVLRAVLRRRAGALVLGEQASADGLPWSEEAFPAFLETDVLPKAPFYCRTFAPEDQEPQRLLVLFHGGLVRGDDLVGEAEALRRLLPDLAVVLPEAPFLVSVDHDLRSWWRPPASSRQPADTREALDLGFFDAPKRTIDRVVLTIQWAMERFKGLPLLLGGFSQGSMLAAQSLGALGQAGVEVRGLAILSGLVAPFALAKGTKCLAIHGDEDDRIEVALASEAAAAQRRQGPEVRLEVLKGMGHAISDEALDLLVDFFKEAAPATRAVSAWREESEWVQDANQAKVLRWVKNVSRATSMFDDKLFMHHITRLEMKGVGSECPTIGNGLIPYKMREVQSDRSGVAIIFHGKVQDLRAETYYLSEAYKKLRMSTCIVDYRQKYSQFCVDASIVMEELETITGDSSTPIVIHGIGCGAIHALHMAVASQAYPAALRRRLRLLVLDGAVSNFKSLPPMPTGCIATDPIGNDQKLKYIGMPLCLIGGDDACCGAKWTQGHWMSLLKSAEALIEERKLPALTAVQGTALVEGAAGRFCSEVYHAISDALNSSQGVKGEATQLFMTDVLANCTSDEDALVARQFKAEELEEICNKVVEAAKGEEVVAQLWGLLKLDESKRGEEHYKLVVSTHLPFLRGDSRFPKGLEGFRQFETSVEMLSELHAGLTEVRKKIQDVFNIEKLASEVARLEADKGTSMGVRWAKAHEAMDWAIQQWESEELWDETVANAQATGDIRPRVMSLQTVKELGNTLSAACAKQLGFDGPPEEVSMKMKFVVKYYAMADPSLDAKIHKAMKATAKFEERLLEHFRELKAATKRLQDAPQPAAPKPVEATPAVSRPAEPSQLLVQVIAEHAVEGGFVSVHVPASATLLDVRKAVVAQLEDAELDEITLVDRMGESGFRVLADSAPLGSRRIVLTTGRALVSEPAATTPSEKTEEADGDLEIIVHIDRSLGLSSNMTLPRGSCVRAVKEQLAEADPTGMTKPEDFGLRLPDAGEGAPLLDDGERITTAMHELDVCLPGM